LPPAIVEGFDGREHNDQTAAFEGMAASPENGGKKRDLGEAVAVGEGTEKHDLAFERVGAAALHEQASEKHLSAVPFGQPRGSATPIPIESRCEMFEGIKRVGEAEQFHL
jgi:hypothetical protein